MGLKIEFGALSQEFRIEKGSSQKKLESIRLQNKLL